MQSPDVGIDCGSNWHICLHGLSMMMVVMMMMMMMMMMMFVCFSADALEKNQQLEFERNKERFAFLKVKFCLTFALLINISC
jgi:uncharacterized membrane protein